MSKLFLDGSKLHYHLPRVKDWMDGRFIYPIHVEISPSGSCNQRCNLCYVDYWGHKKQMLQKEILQQLTLDFREVGVKSVLLAGEGEPLLNPHIDEMIQSASKVGIDMALNSNAVLLNNQRADRILDKLTWARFTFQSSREDKYNLIHRGGKEDFRKAVSNLEYVVHLKKHNKLNVTLGIQQILINENYQDLFNTAKLSKEIGVDYYVVKRFSKHPSNTYDVPEDLYKESFDEFKKIEALNDNNFKAIVRWNNFTKDCDRIYKKCIGLPFIVQILADGSIYPCSNFFHNKDYCYGNLYKNTFIEILRSDRAHSIRERITNTTDVTNCMSYCRHHSTNQFLWPLYDKPKHINFI